MISKTIFSGMSKSIILVFGLVFMLCIIPFASAQNAVGTTRLVTSTNVGSDNGSITGSDNAEDNGSRDQIKIQDNVKHVVDSALVKAEFKKRVIIQERVKELNVKKEQVINKYQEKKLNFGEIRSQFEVQKTKYADCKAKNVTSDDCINVKNQLKKDSVSYLNNIVDVLISAIDTLSNKINLSEDIDDVIASNLEERLAQRTANLELLKAQLGDLNENSTKEEIALVSSALKAELTMTKNEIKLVEQMLVNSRVGLVVEKTAHLRERLNAIIAIMEAENKDVSVIQDLVDEFNQRIEQAREQYKNANLNLLGVNNSINKGEVAKTSNRYMQQSQVELKEAHKILKNIVSEVRNANGAEYLDSDDSGDETEIEDEN
ncbi:MAG: hypothetical protein K0B02_02245 [DPANN group archaeon]|nr:hypothetical protein [DPANN group archaeon]